MAERQLLAVEDETERIRRADRFNAFVAVRPDPQTPSAGPLSGETIAVKDNVAVAGMPFTAGHGLFAGRMAEADAEVVTQLRSAGARIVGVTQTDAGGFGVTTPEVINPVAPELTAGGSSGGSAAAVAAGLASLGVGTDTGGSVRIPAACCGLYGFKPTRGRVSLNGVWPLAPRFDHIGLLSRSADLAVQASVALLGCEPDDEPAVRVLGLDFDRLATASPQIRGDILTFVEVIESAGVRVQRVVLSDRTTIAGAHSVLVLASARDLYEALSPAEFALLAPAAQRGLAAAAKLEEPEIAAAEAVVAQCVSELADVFAKVDVILTPTLLVDPPPREARRIVAGGEEIPVLAALVAETCLANVTGCPAIALPFGPRRPVPTSVQLMAARGDDRRVLKFALELDRLIAAATPSRNPATGGASPAARQQRAMR